jgi:hypothetical protein
VVAVIFGYFVYSNVRRGPIEIAEKQGDLGKLYFGNFMLVSALIGSAVLSGLFCILIFANPVGEDTALLLIIAATGFFAASCWAELFWTRGVFDHESIRFQSIWKGRRCYKWSQLNNIEFNPGMDWHVLYFDEGKEILISKYMKGRRELLTLARSMGHFF